MKLDPYANPHRSATLLAMCSVLGLLGLFVFDGPAGLPTFLLAALPFALGVIAWVRGCRVQPSGPR